MFDINKKGVYKIVFPDGRFYIGSAWGINGIKNRWEEHKKGHYSSPKYLSKIAQLFGGWDNSQIIFFILINIENINEILFWEQFYIYKYWPVGNKDPLLLNKNREIWKPPDNSGESNPFFGKKHTDETKEKIKKARANQPSPMLGKHHSDETKKKLVEARANQPSPMLDKHHTDETKEKLREARANQLSPMLGKHHSDEAKEKISKANSGKTGPMLGKHHTEETKEKLREINLDKKHSAETKEKLSKIFHTSGEECSYSKLTWEEVNKIREKYLTGNYSQAELAVEYSVSRATIKKIVNCESWKGNKKNESRNS